MSKENEKLLAVKKSCKGVKIVSLILLITTIVATILALASGIIMTAGSSKIDPYIKQAQAEGNTDVDIMYQGMKIGRVDLPDPDNWHSDVPAIQEKFDEGSISFVFGLYLFIVFGILVFTAIVLALFYSVFDIIVKEETPFSDKVIRRLLISLILVDLILGGTIGWGFTILGGFVTWAIITIMQYGKELQIQSDETL